MVCKLQCTQMDVEAERQTWIDNRTYKVTHTTRTSHTNVHTHIWIQTGKRTNRFKIYVWKMIYSGRTTYQCHETVTFSAVYLSIWFWCFFYILFNDGLRKAPIYTLQNYFALYKLSYYCGRFFGLNDVGCIDMNQADKRSGFDD